jgi:ParB-like chromosome segregation protein Spo0J
VELRRVKPTELDLSLGRLRQVPEGAVREKLESLRSKGQLSPLVAAEQAGVLVLIDGFARHLAAVRLGLESVLVEVVQLSPVQMKAQVYLRNRERGFQLLEECRLVRELAEAEGQSQVEIGELLERHKSWVCRRLSLMRSLSPSLVEDLSLGLLGPGSLRQLALLQPRNQEELVAVSKREGLGPRDTATLVDLWRRAPDPESRRYLIDHPQDAIRRARGKPDEPVDPRLGQAGRQALEGMTALRQTSLRLLRRLRDGLGDLPPEGVAVLAEARRRAAEDSRSALEAVEGWLSKQGGAS